MALLSKWEVWICRLFHKKEVKRVEWMYGPFEMHAGLWKGCKKCDYWRKL